MRGSHVVLGAMIAAIATLHLAPARAGVAIVFVNAAATGANNGTSWEDAYKELSTAINATPGVSPGSIDIWVAKGTYKPTTSTVRQIAFTPKAGHQIFGGFAGTETSRDERNINTNPTILSGDIGGVGNPADNSNSVVTFGGAITATTVLDGFTVQDGNANGPIVMGGGILGANGAAPTLAHLKVKSNTAAQFGGGVLLAGPAALTDVRVEGNKAPVGAGVAVLGGAPTFENCNFTSNDAGAGAGGGVAVFVGKATFSNGTVQANKAKNGAGVFVNAGAEATLSGTLLATNTASASGGGLLSLGKVTLTGTRITSNDAVDGAGASITSGSATFGAGVKFERNDASGAGGGLFNGLGTGLTLDGVEFTLNEAGVGGGIAGVDAPTTVLNSAFRENTSIETSGIDVGGGAIRQEGASLTVTNSQFSENEATRGGGAVLAVDASVEIGGSSFDHHAASQGGAVLIKAAPTGTVSSSQFDDNDATQGGAIFIVAATDSVLVISGSRFDENRGPAGGGSVFFQGGTSGELRVLGTTFTNNTSKTGAAIGSTGLLTIEDSSFTKNQGTPGVATKSAAVLASSVTVRRTTFSGNIAVPQPPGIGEDPPPASPDRFAASALAMAGGTIEDTVFDGNEGGFALDTATGLPGGLSLVNVTFSDNSGGAIRVGTRIVDMENVTIASNEAPTHGAIARFDLAPGSIDIHNSLIFGNGDAAIEAVAGDDINDALVEGGCPAPATCAGIIDADPLLKPLADNGGPTRTRALSVGSPAVDAGDNSPCEPADQRGAERPLDGDGNGSEICDLGAFELGPDPVGFKAASSHAAEANTDLTIDVTLGAALTEAASVKYRVSGGTATNRKDYALARGTLTFAPGDTVKSIDLTLKDDFFVEEPETIVISLESPGNAILGIAEHTFTITDNERRLKCEGTAATMVGTAGSDVISGTPGVDVVVALGGADTVKGLRGDDLVCAGGGSDTVDGGGGSDTILGNGGNDLLRGGAGDDLERGGGGADQMRGAGGNDELRGEGGTDQLFGERGKDRLSGGPGPADHCDGGPAVDALLAGHGCEVVVAVP